MELGCTGHHPAADPLGADDSLASGDDQRHSHRGSVMSSPNVKTPPGWGGVRGKAGEASNCFATINQAAELRPIYTPAALCDLKFKAHDRKNSRGEIIKGNGSGPTGMWVQIGSKVLIDLPVAVRWIESHRIGGL